MNDIVFRLLFSTTFSNRQKWEATGEFHSPVAGVASPVLTRQGFSDIVSHVLPAR
jgi:hypothetical protein